jgi:hypothetical protein
MKLRHIAAFFMLLGALGCQPSDSSSSSTDEGAGGATTVTPDSDSTADTDPAIDEELKTVSFNVAGMK